MTLINFEIKHDGVNISDHVINYSRFQYICTGIGTIDIQLENINLNRTISPWDTIVLYEDGNKIGTYIVSSVIRSAEGGTLTLQCQDYSKKLVDHFVTDTNIVTYSTTTRYWIELFLNEADLSYEFTTDTQGEIVGPNASYGLSSAYDLIMTLLQQSGWYIYFDKNGKAIIGQLNKAGDHYDSVINEDDIISLERARNDARLRNRAVVWGAGDPVTGTWIGADISRNTPWNYDSNDKRAVVLSNGMIYSTITAEDLANKMLNEFAQIANEITVELINHYDINLGDLVYVRSKYFSGRMMVTTIESTGSKDGMVVKITLNQKCPRLFAYFGILGEYIPVYIGTWGQGVWKKYTGGSTWTDSSSGLIGNALYIIDLFIKNGTLACVTNDGYLYIANITTNVWTKFEHGDLIDLDVNLYLEPTVKAVNCSIDDMGNIIAGYIYQDESITRSWILTISGIGTLIKAEQIILDDNQDIKILDLEAVGYPEEGIIESVTTPPINFAFPGTKTYQNYNTVDPNCYGIGPQSSYTHDGVFLGVSNFLAGFIINTEDKCWYLSKTTGSPVKLVFTKSDLPSLTVEYNYEIDKPSDDFNTGAVHFLHRESDSVFNIVSVFGSGNDLKLRHYTYTVGGTTLTQLYEATLQGSYTYFGLVGASLQGNNVIVSYTNTEVPVTTIDLRGFVYNVVGTQPTSFLITTITKVDDFEETIYTPNTYYAPTTIGVNTGFYYMKGYKKNFFEYYKQELRISGGEITSAGGFNFSGDTTVLSWSTNYDTIYPSIEINPSGFLWDTSSSINNYWASSSIYAYLFNELMLIEHNNLQTKDVHRSIVFSIKIPDEISTTDERVFYGPTPGATHKDYTGLHLYNNTVFDIASVNLYPVHGKVRKPKWIYFFNQDSGNNYCQLTFINADNLVTSYYNLTANKGFTPGPTTTAVAVSYRGDYDGSVYIAINGSGGNSGFYAFNNGVNTKFVDNLNNSGHLAKNYLLSTTSIKKLEPPTIGVVPQVLRHTSAPFEGGLIGASLNATEQTYGIFEVIFIPDEIVKVEISKGAPSVIYTPPYWSGGIHTPIMPYLAASLTNNVDNFYFPPANNYMFYDARVFDIPNTSGEFTIASGILPTSLLERYIALATSGEITLIKYDLTGQFYPLVMMSGLLALASGVGANPSGAITLFETTNYTLDPYMFVGVSGPPSLFFQRGSPYYPYWVNYSFTLPSSDMTIIRVDDFI